MTTFWQVVGAWFIGGGAMGSEARPAFVPSEICRYFYAVGDRLIRQVLSLIQQVRRVSVSM